MINIDVNVPKNINRKRVIEKYIDIEIRDVQTQRYINIETEKHIQTRSQIQPRRRYNYKSTNKNTVAKIQTQLQNPIHRYRSVTQAEIETEAYIYTESGTGNDRHTETGTYTVTQMDIVTDREPGTGNDRYIEHNDI